MLQLLLDQIESVVLYANLLASVIQPNHLGVDARDQLPFHSREGQLPCGYQLRLEKLSWDPAIILLLPEAGGGQVWTSQEPWSQSQHFVPSSLKWKYACCRGGSG